VDFQRGAGRSAGQPQSGAGAVDVPVFVGSNIDEFFMVRVPG